MVVGSLALHTQNPSLECVYTNKGKARFLAQTGKSNSRKWHGFGVGNTTYVSDTVLKLGSLDESGNTNSSTWQNTRVAPATLKRFYSVHNAKTHVTEETLCPLGLNALLVCYFTAWEGEAFLYPQFDVRPHGWSMARREGYQWTWLEGDKALVVRHRDASGWVALVAKTSIQFQPTDFEIWNGFFSKDHPRDRERGDGGQGECFQPGCFKIAFESGIPQVFAYGVADTFEKAVAVARTAVMQFDDLKAAKKNHQLQLCQLPSGVEPKSKSGKSDDSRLLFWCSQPQTTQAVTWAQMSLDALVSNAFGHGIFAGLPWFDQYWGRDAFIAFPGAVLVTGRFATARAILAQSFKCQDTRPGSSTLGRIPNNTSDAGSLYNTADGTPWLLRAVFEYVSYSGDLALVSEVFEAVSLAIQAEMARMDDQGFSCHGDQETWMDAKRVERHAGENLTFVCTPRGNRAVEVQALWFTALVGSARLATALGESTKAQEWSRAAERLRGSFRRYFWSEENRNLADHLKPSGVPDGTPRPNSLVAISVAALLEPLPFPLIDHAQERDVVRCALADEVITSWGVRSMSPQGVFFNPDLARAGHEMSNTYAEGGFVRFHPYHEYGSRQGLCHPDWSYHTGDAWHWLAGPAIEALVRQDLVEEAWHLSESQTHHLLEGLCLGSLAEIMDGENFGAPRGWDKGATSQAWSLGEYLRVFFQCYLGYRPNVLEQKVSIAPKLPQALEVVHARVPYGAQSWLDLKISDGGHTIAISCLEPWVENHRPRVCVCVALPRLAGLSLGTPVSVNINGRAIDSFTRSHKNVGTVGAKGTEGTWSVEFEVTCQAYEFSLCEVRCPAHQAHPVTPATLSSWAL